VLPSQSLDILIVEDHRDTARALMMLLNRRGHRVIVAHGAEAALALANHSRFDLLLCDIQLPDGDGWSLLSEIRKLYPITAIACTAKAMESDIERSMQAGFAAHITKPVALDDLLRRIEEAKPS